MIVNPTPGKQYTMRELDVWFSQAQEDGEVLEIFPCNPKDAKMLWAKMVIKDRNDMAVLTQWLGGIPRG